MLTAVLVSGSSCAAWVVPASPRRCGDVLALAKPPAARGGGERGPSAAKRWPSRARPARPGGSERRAALRRVCEAVRARSRDDVETLLPERNWSSGEWAAMVQAAGQVGDWACARRLIDRLEGSRAKGARGGSAYAAAYGHAIAACARASKLQARAVKPRLHRAHRRGGRQHARALICVEMRLTGARCLSARDRAARAAAGQRRHARAPVFQHAHQRRGARWRVRPCSSAAR